MNIKGEGKSNSSVAVSVWERSGRKTKKGKSSITFTVENTTMDELADFLKAAIRKAA